MGKRSGSVWVTFAAVSVSVCACSIIVSTSDLAATGGKASSDASDDQLRASDADASASATADASAADARSTQSDAGFCPPNAIFCDDFERASMAESWDGIRTTNGSTIGFIDGTPTGRALHAHVSAGEVGSTNDYIWRQTAAVPTQTVTLSLAVRLPTIPARGAAQIAQLAFHDGSGAFSLLMPFLTGGQLVVAEFRCDNGNCQFEQSAVPAPRLSGGDWHQVAVSVTFGTGPASLSVSLDGKTIGQKSSTVGMVPGKLEIRAGLVVVDAPNDAFDLEVDRLVVTGQ